MDEALPDGSIADGFDGDECALVARCQRFGSFESVGKHPRQRPIRRFRQVIEDV
jgi:hypothetical protein